jgi:subtilase family serine protease
MKKWALLPLFAVMVLLGASLTFTESRGARHGVIIVPYSSQEMPWDVGVRAHTNYVIMVRPGATGTSPAGETPGSLSCVYQTQTSVDSVAGCTISGTSGKTLSGGTETIAIVDAFDYPTATNDFGVFSSTFGLTGGSFRKVFASGSQPRLDRGWALEEALDIEWSHAMAPDANIVLVEAASNSFTNLFAAVDVATNEVVCHNTSCPSGGTGKGEVSMSWGGSEFSSEASNDGHFVHSGVVYFASSGDSGGKVIYPSASPDVVSAGGTSVNRDRFGSFTGESAWSSGGGGPSADESRPGYQDGIISIVGSARGTPDFSFDADPNTGVSIYTTTSFEGLSGWIVVGGTSVSSPSLAGIVNLANHFYSGTAEQGTIYTCLATSSCYSSNFRDITSGSNGFSATSGWDFATGVGTNKGLSGK